MDEKITNQIKTLGIDMIQNAQSGHPGIVLGAAPILYTLYGKHMHICKEDPAWPNRDRFILSAGHGSALLYATLFMAGLDYTIEDLKGFRHLHSRTPGHPEIDTSPYVEATTGPLGQGLAMGVGVALSQKILSHDLNEIESLCDFYTYVLCGDGDLMEGISYEASSFAGTQNLDHLIVLYDSNETTLDHKTSSVFEEDILARFNAMHWHTEKVEDGNNVDAIDAAIKRCKKVSKPSLIEVCTTLGKDSLLENNPLIHGAVLKEEDLCQLKEKLKVGKKPFYVDASLKEAFEDAIKNRSTLKYKAYLETVQKIGKEPFLREETAPIVDFSHLPLEKEGVATRFSNEKIMNEISRQIPYFLGGSADLSSSTRTYLSGKGDFDKENRDGKNIFFGVREHAMGAILNGLSFSHLKCFGSTFLVFSDYMKPAIRLSALMKRPVCYIFTHDSIAVGQDGPTHEPIEQMAMLRSIPNLYTFRPCDEKEVRGAWKVILRSTQTPSALILSRTGKTLLEKSREDMVAKGAYIVHHEKKSAKAVLIATGSEVEEALRAAEELWEKGIDLRVVSMPCMELYKEQDSLYQEEILPTNLPRIVIEASTKWSFGPLSPSVSFVTIEQFGYSGKEEAVKEILGFTYEQIKQKIERLVKE